jgi:hypothetical protein
VTRVYSLVLLGASIVAMGVAMALGTSAAVPYFGSTGPFLTLDGSPPFALVATLTWFAAISAGAGTLTGLYVVRRGSFLAPMRLLVAGAVVAGVLAMLPPTGSVDLLNYAIYGRIARLGRDPYSTTPLRLSHTGDPVGLLMPSAWQRMPTVYGPITTGIQWAAAYLGGNVMAHIIFLLKWGNAVAFVGTAVVLDRLVGPDPVRRMRAALLWAVNPIMLFWMVGSGHADVYAVFFLVLALYATRRSALLGGLSAGAAVAVKASFLFPAAAVVAVAWFAAGSLLIRLGRAAQAVTGLLLVAGGGYLLAGPSAIHSLSARLGRQKDRYLPVPDVVRGHQGMYGLWFMVLAAALVAFLWWRSGLPVAFWRGWEAGLPEFMPVPVVAFGTTLVSPLQYPWYDAMLLPLLALLPLAPYARLDRLLILRGVIMGLMTLPGVEVDGVRHVAVRWVNLAWLLYFVVAVWRGSRRDEGAPGPESEPPRSLAEPAAAL